MSAGRIAAKTKDSCMLPHTPVTCTPGRWHTRLMAERHSTATSLKQTNRWHALIFGTHLEGQTNRHSLQQRQMQLLHCPLQWTDCWLQALVYSWGLRPPGCLDPLASHPHLQLQGLHADNHADKGFRLIEGFMRAWTSAMRVSLVRNEIIERTAFHCHLSHKSAQRLIHIMCMHAQPRTCWRRCLRRHGCRGRVGEVKQVAYAGGSSSCGSACCCGYVAI